MMKTPPPPTTIRVCTSTTVKLNFCVVVWWWWWGKVGKGTLGQWWIRKLPATEAGQQTGEKLRTLV